MSNVTTRKRAAAVAASSAFDPFADIVLLSRHEDAPAPRPDFIACISAGFKNASGTPEVSRDGTIHVSDPSDRAPGLKAALADGGGKVLTITLPSDTMGDVFFQHYRKEGKTRLEAHGDAEGITTIAADGKRAYWPAGTPEFEKLRAECKVTYEIAFYLAGWDTSEGTPRPQVYWPDGVGAYRLRSTSPKTASNFIACVRELAARTGGPVAGFPLEVRLVYPKVADPTGTKRAVPLFSFIVKPPGGLVMDAGQFRAIAAESVALLPTGLAALPPAPTLDDALEEFELLAVPMDANECRKGFFGMVKGTRWATEEGRDEFFRAYTNGVTDSFSTWLKTATVEDMHALLDHVEAMVAGIDPGTGEVIEATAEVVSDDEPPAPPADDSNEAPTEEQNALCGALVRKLALTPEAGRDILREKFNKASRQVLTRGEMAQFIAHLDGLAKAQQKEEGDA